MKRIVVYEAEGIYDPRWIPESLSDAVDWLSAHLASIPEEYRGSARVEFRAFPSYGDVETELSIYYDRPLTAEEQANEAQALERIKRREEEVERALLDTLRRKYGA